MVETRKETDSSLLFNTTLYSTIQHGLGFKNGWPEGVFNFILGSLGLKQVKKGSVDAFLYNNLATWATALAMIEVDTNVDPRNNVLNICIIEDKETLATKFKSDLLQVTV